MEQDNKKLYPIIALIVGGVIVLAILGVFLIKKLYPKKSNVNDIIKDAYNEIKDTYDDIKDDEIEFKVNDFNFFLEDHKGPQSGLIVTMILDDVIEKTKTNSDHPIVVVYGSTSASNADEITRLKAEIGITSNYEITLNYDSNGYINKITIKNLS